MKKSLLVMLAVGCVILAADALPVDQKALVEQYKMYNGKKVIINGEVVSDSEATVMYLLNETGDSTRHEAMLITLTDEASQKPDALVKRFTKQLKKKGRVTAKLEGSFQGADDRRWGHQVCCRFWLKVERVVSLKEK